MHEVTKTERCGVCEIGRQLGTLMFRWSDEPMASRNVDKRPKIFQPVWEAMNCKRSHRPTPADTERIGYCDENCFVIIVFFYPWSASAGRGRGCSGRSFRWRGSDGSYWGWVMYGSKYSVVLNSEYLQCAKRDIIRMLSFEDCREAAEQRQDRVETNGWKLKEFNCKLDSSLLMVCDELTNSHLGF